MNAYDMGRFYRIVATEGRVSGNWWVARSTKPGEFHVKPIDVTLWDEGRNHGRVLYTPDLTAFVRGGGVDIPLHMVRSDVRDDVLDALSDIKAAVSAGVSAAAFASEPGGSDHG